MVAEGTKNLLYAAAIEFYYPTASLTFEVVSKPKFYMIEFALLNVLQFGNC